LGDLFFQEENKQVKWSPLERGVGLDLGITELCSTERDPWRNSEPPAQQELGRRKRNRHVAARGNGNKNNFLGIRKDSTAFAVILNVAEFV